MVVGRRDMYSRSQKFHQDLHLFTNCLAVGKKMEVLKELLASTEHGGQRVANLFVPWAMKHQRRRQQHKYSKVG